MSWMNRATAACPSGKFVHISRLGGYYDLKYYRSCEHLIGNTEDIRDYLVNQGWPEAKAHYLPNFAEDVSAEPFPRPSLYTPSDGRLVFAMGRLHKNKAFDVLIQAMAQVPDTYLWLAGDGPLRGELEVLAERVGVKPRVRFPRLAGRHLFAPCGVRRVRLPIAPRTARQRGPRGLGARQGGGRGRQRWSRNPGRSSRNRIPGFRLTMSSAWRTVSATCSTIRRCANVWRARGRARFDAEFSEAVVVQRFVAFFEEIMGAS